MTMTDEQYRDYSKTELIEKLAHEILEEENEAMSLMAIGQKSCCQEEKLRTLFVSLGEKMTYLRGLKRGIDLSKFC